MKGIAGILLFTILTCSPVTPKQMGYKVLKKALIPHALAVSAAGGCRFHQASASPVRILASVAYFCSDPMLKIYNSLSRSLEEFQPINPPFVGIYICGPTVYGPPHLGHVRGPIVFDVMRRHLNHLGFKTRFVRNITDVGHLVGDGNEGDDKLAKQAKIEQIEPMEIAQLYTEKYNWAMRKVNVQSPDIEPRASGHIQEQIGMIEQMLANGFAYETGGNVYFEVAKFAKTHDYGKLSGRILEDLLDGAGNDARQLEGQDIKKSPADFALWKKASPEHIMKWNSPWGVGYPGWHIECSAMSAKYLGQTFDIHGGGMDLLFPHHEAEIAQSKAACGHAPAKYWLHHNMITINGQKMAKSLNNGIMVSELFSGENYLLEQAYSPMTLRFFVLQAHYRGTLDFSNAALQASEKGLKRMLEAAKITTELSPSKTNDYEVSDIENNIINAMNDDLSTPQVIAHLFEAARVANSVNGGQIMLNEDNITKLNTIFDVYLFGILGIAKEKENDSELLGNMVQLLINMRTEAKMNKNYALSDEIRDKLAAAGVQIKDSREGTTWTKN